jgi:hypothetical protein
MKFTSVNDAILYLDISGTHTKIKAARGMAYLMREGRALTDAEDHATNLLHFIESYDLKREVEAQFAEGDGAIDFAPGPGEEAPIEGDDYFAPVDAVKQLYTSWQARKARRGNVVEMQKR